MTRIYAQDGTPIDIVKREAKRLKQEQGIKLSEAQRQIALAHGFESYEALSAALIEADEDLPDHLYLARKAGADEIVFDFSDCHEKSDTYFRVFPNGNLGKLCLTRHASYEDAGSIRIEIRLSLSTDLAEFEHFTPKVEISLDDLEEAFDEIMEENRPGMLISMMNRAGMFDIPAYENLRFGEHEALLQLALREQKRLVQDRILFNTGGATSPEGQPDWGRRCFVNLLDNGQVLISNGSEDVQDLKWKVIERPAFDQLVAEMQSAFPQGYLKTWDSEAWMHDRVLSAPEAEDTPSLS